MGEVYKARDTRLDRLVAIKVLSPALSGSAEARERFEREAHAISRLSHPHICALFDVGSSGETFYLVMELLDGETLGTMIARGPLPMPEVLRIGAAIADALASAHRQGIVHRDLKPGNVLLTRSGVKLLDFGLAKTFQPAGRPSDLTGAATAAALTAPGTWLGTAPYMSPEQIDGRLVDGRSDVFALGAVLYEMATGVRAFSGQSSSAIVAGILHQDPAPMSSLVPNIPAAFDRLVRGCLEKDPDRRWQSAHDVALQLGSVASHEDRAPAAAGASRGWISVAGWAAAIIATTIAGWALVAGRTEVIAPGRVELEIGPPTNSTFTYDVETVRFALSPDGRELLFIAADDNRVRWVWRRMLSSVEAKAIPGTDGASSAFWSPDGQAIAFFVGDTLKKLDLASGAAVAICKVPRAIGLTGTWNRDGDILFATVEGGAIFHVPTAGGEPTVELKPEASRNEVRISFPSFLPDGKRYLYSARHRDGSTALMLAERGKDPQTVGPIESNAQFVEPSTLVFARDGALVGQPFDAETGRLSGEPVAIAKSVRFFLSTSLADFSASLSGSVVYQSHTNLMRIVWVDRSGRELSTIGSSAQYFTVRISPQQRSALVSRALRSNGTFDVWSLDFERGTETRLTLDDHVTEVAGILTRDEQTMYYGDGAGGPPNVLRMDLRTGRSEKFMAAKPHLQQAEDISPDGRFLAYSERTDGGFHNLWAVPLNGPGEPALLRQSPANQEEMRFSPDSAHYAFISNESGRYEVYVATIGAGSKTMVSANGGSVPRWGADGRTLYYLSSDRRLMSVPVRIGSTLEVGTPTTLFAVAGRGWEDFDVTRDGTRFLALVPQVQIETQPLTAVQHWNAAPR